jgi:[ribosomal protein S18]-alanine N-acetyltransferase
MLRSNGTMEINQLTFSIEPLRAEDIPDAVRLEESCGLSSRQEAGYQHALHQPHEILLVVLMEPVAIDPRHLVGLFSGVVVVDELQIDNVVVAEDYRRYGLASRLLTEALRLAPQHGAVSAILEVRAQNASARALYQKYGFSVTGLRRAYYHEPPDDALILSLNLRQGIENAP